MRTAVVHDWLETYAGSERVIEQILSTVGPADVFTLVDFVKKHERAFLKTSTVHTSFIQRLPFARRNFRAYLPLMPLAIEQFDLTDYDLILSSNHAVAKGVLTREDQVHLCYIHTPIRYAWDLYHAYLKEHKLRYGPKSVIARMVLHYLRLWDYSTSARVDAFAANSHYVARRIWKTYRRSARVIYPPVDVERFQLATQKDKCYVTVSRLVPYKRVDLIIEAFRLMPTRTLIVVGGGPEYSRLAERAPQNVKMLGHQPLEAVINYLQKARAFVFAADEDFGISPVEAQACGTPVIAYNHGGVTESVRDGETGVFFNQQNAESLAAAVEKFESRERDFSPHVIRAHAEEFSPERFRLQFKSFIKQSVARHHRKARSRYRKRLPHSESAIPVVPR